MKWLPTDGVSIYILIYIYNYYFILVYFLYILFKKQGYTEHLISTTSEWIFGILLMILILTFVNDFRKIKIQHPVVIENIIQNKI